VQATPPCWSRQRPRAHPQFQTPKLLSIECLSGIWSCWLRWVWLLHTHTHMCNTDMTQAAHRRHMCNTDMTQAAYRQHMCNTDMTQTAHRRHMCNTEMTQAAYRQHMCNTEMTQAAHRQHMCNTYMTQAAYKQHMCNTDMTHEARSQHIRSARAEHTHTQEKLFSVIFWSIPLALMETVAAQDLNLRAQGNGRLLFFMVKSFLNCYFLTRFLCMVVLTFSTDPLTLIRLCELDC